MSEQQGDMIEVPEPPHAFLLNFYKQTVKNFTTYLFKRLYEVNITKSSAVNPHRRESLMGHIHRLVFTVLGKKFLRNERIEITPKQVKFHLFSLQRVYEVFSGINLCRFHKTGDTTIAAPWAYFSSTYTTADDGFEIEAGSVVIIIERDAINNTAKIFVPCGGPDPETDFLPTWVEDVKVSDICNVDIEKIPARKSEGISSQIKKNENWFIALKNQVEEGDIISFNKERVKVIGIGIDFMSDFNNSIRIENEFQRDHSAQSFKIIRMPMVKGKIFDVPLDLCNIYRPVEVMLANINSFDIGTASVHYYNFCFNEMGFLTHDTAICM